MLRVVRRQYPHLKIVMRARNRQHVGRLMDLGIDEPVCETLYSSFKMSRNVLEALGLSSSVAVTDVERFRRLSASVEHCFSSQCVVVNMPQKQSVSRKKSVGMD